jgi:hypothetical protein
MLNSDHGLFVKTVRRTVEEEKVSTYSSTYAINLLNDNLEQILRWPQLSIAAFEQGITGRELAGGVLS